MKDARKSFEDRPAPDAGRSFSSGEDEAVPAVTQPPAIDLVEQSPPSSVHEMAARGEGAAFSTLANWHYLRGADGIEPAIIAYARSCDYARLAAMSRGEREDWTAFLFILDQHAQALRSAGFDQLADQALGEAVAIAEFMAEDGDDEIADMLTANADSLSPKSLTIARDLREHVKGIVEC